MSRPDRAPTGRFERNPETAVRDADACRLRSRGLTYQQIADEMGYADHSGARDAVKRAVTAIVEEPAQEIRQRELERLDEAYKQVLKVLEAPHVLVSQGRVMRDDQGNVMPDDAPVLAAVDRIVKIMERRAKLLGLDAPKQLEVSTTAESDFERAYADLTEQMRRRSEQAASQ